MDRPLRDVFEYHLELGAEQIYDPIYFIVATVRDWKKEGVLLVTLDDDNLECKVDSFQIKAEASGLSVVNLQIANSSWDEEKECYALDSGGESGDDDNDDSGNDGNDSSKVSDDGGP